jgi:hypothetical protein
VPGLRAGATRASGRSPGMSTSGTKETTDPYAALRDKVGDLRHKHGELTDAEIVDALNSPEDAPITLGYDPEAAP